MLVSGVREAIGRCQSCAQCVFSGVQSWLCIGVPVAVFCLTPLDVVRALVLRALTCGTLIIDQGGYSISFQQ